MTDRHGSDATYSLYGVVNAFSEQFAHVRNEAHGLRCYGLHIGWVTALDENHRPSGRNGASIEASGNAAAGRTS